MPLPLTITAYQDISPILDEAVRRRGGRYRLASPAAALRWRQRAYMLRRLIREQDGTSQYDEIVMRLDDSTILFELASTEGVFETAAGEPVELANEFDEEAADLVKELGLD